MKHQWSWRKAVRGIVFAAVVMLCSSLWADSVLLQFGPYVYFPTTDTSANPTVTPGASTQVAVADSVRNEGFTSVSSNILWNKHEVGLVYNADVNGLHTTFVDSNANLISQSDYTIAFTATGSNVIVDEIKIETLFGDDGSGSFRITSAVHANDFNFGTCDQFDLVPGQDVVAAGECFAFADGEIHDLGLVTDVDDLQIQIPNSAAPVPEPGSLLLLGTGLLSGATRLRRKLGIRN